MTLCAHIICSSWLYHYIEMLHVHFMTLPVCVDKVLMGPFGEGGGSSMYVGGCLDNKEQTIPLDSCTPANNQDPQNIYPFFFSCCEIWVSMNNYVGGHVSSVES